MFLGNFELVMEESRKRKICAFLHLKIENGLNSLSYGNFITKRRMCTVSQTGSYLTSDQEVASNIYRPQQ